MFNKYHLRYNGIDKMLPSNANTVKNNSHYIFVIPWLIIINGPVHVPILFSLLLVPRQVAIWLMDHTMCFHSKQVL
jgi:hypothetical protein